MFASLLSVLLASAQPAPTEEPVVTDVAVQAEVDIQAEAPVEPAEPETPAATATAEAEVEAAPAGPEEEVICRRRLLPAERIGQRHRVVRDCRPASDWGRTSRSRRGGD